MRRILKSRGFSMAVMAGLLTASFHASPEDIDIFSVDEGTSLNAPNVLIVLDNSANWARASQQWPESEEQGQSEVSALKTVISELNGTINVGLMLHITGGSSTDQDSAYIRAHIRPMTIGNKAILLNQLDTIYDNINAPAEKRSQGNPFGNLFWDIYNYLAGGNHSNSGAGTSATLADTTAYDVTYSNFRSPLTSNDTCARTIVIFIGNNVSSGPSADSTLNVDALKLLATNSSDPPDPNAGTTAVAQLRFADYVVERTEVDTPLGLSEVCYSSASSCTTAENNAACLENGFLSCTCDADDFVACPSTHWTVVGTKTASETTTVSDNTVVTTSAPTGEIPQCRNNLPPGACTLPPNSTQTFNDQNCPSGAASCTAAANHVSTISTSWSGSCAYIDSGQSCGTESSGKTLWRPSGTKTERSVVERTDTVATQTSLGETTACYNDAATCNPNDGGVDCFGFDSCSCTTAGSATGCAPGGTERYMVNGTSEVIEATQTGTFSAAPAGPFMMDEWARFLRQTGVTIPGVSVKNQVTTYTIDVFNAQQDPVFSGLLFNAARAGGGRYYQARNKNAIINALRNIFTEVQAVNSAFSSASLPINATNRTQNENQVFIGVFKPSRDAFPLWFGNLKRFQIIRDGADITLGDSLGQPAINNQTGFLGDCAVSFWTTDSGTYWNTVITDNPDALSICSTNATSDWSDSPDGPFVEKGAAAEVLRKGNDPSATPDAEGSYVLNRTVKTIASGALVDFTATTFDDGDVDTAEDKEQIIVDFIRGADVDNLDDLDTNTAEPRSTIHGDVVHSRPQPVNYGGTTGVVIYYGANDGLFRAVKASTGQELWSFVAPEHFSKLTRLRNNIPVIQYPNPSTSPAPGTAPKDYFFDGSTGVFQSFNADNTVAKAIIFPTMRRGGRKLYAFDVTNPSAPIYLWSKGCPNLTNDTGCDAGFENIGQTWSIASVAFLKGYSETRPVIITGGGYDRGDDEDSKTPTAASKGRGVYVLDAQDGTLIKHFDFSTLSGVPARGVAADVAMISIDSDKFVDYAYAVDTGGNVYRMDFIDGPATQNPLAAANWTFGRVAYTNGSTRKFLFAPALLQNGERTVYLAVGSGDREHPLMSDYPFGDGLDPATAVLNRFYVLKDDVGDTDAATVTNLDDPTAMADYTTDAGCDAERITPSSAKKGWFMSLNENGIGEQTVSSAVIAGGFVNFSTNRPTPPDALSCSTSLGEARGYFVNLLNASGAIGVDGSCGGSRSSEFVGGGLPPSPVIATVQVGDRVETIVIGAVPKDGGEGSAIAPTLRNPNLDTKRRPVYWYKSSGDN